MVTFGESAGKWNNATQASPRKRVEAPRKDHREGYSRIGSGPDPAGFAASWVQSESHLLMIAGAGVEDTGDHHRLMCQ